MGDPQVGSPRSAYRYADGMGDLGSDGGGGPGAEAGEAPAGWDAPLRRRRLAAEAARALQPWLLCMLLGVLTALTGSCIAVNCDFLGDLRFGFCRGIALADRSHCCGGAENVDLLRERCIPPAVSLQGPSGARPGAEWVPWAEFFGVESRLESWGGYALSFLVYVLSSVLWTGLGTLLVHEYCPAARGSGIPEVKAAVSGFDMPQSFSGWCLLVKTLGLSLVVGAGLSLGKEGPLIHIGVCWAYVLRRALARLGLAADALPLHELSCVGAAAGVSTAFGAPLGGVLFAVEELGSVRSLSRQTLLFAFMAAFSASFTLKYLNLSGANRLTLFALSLSTHNPRKEWITWEMLAFCILGMGGGLVGVLFIKLNLWCAASRRHFQRQGALWMLPSWASRWLASLVGQGAHGAGSPSMRSLNVAEGVLIALLTALLNYPLTALLRRMSTEAIHALFEACPKGRADHFGLCASSAGGGASLSPSTFLSLLLAGAVRLVQTSYTFGAALPSGLFIPSLFIGATLGRLMGSTMQVFVEHEVLASFKVHIEPGMFAIVGAVAMLSGFCRMTVSLVVIMFELTGELTYVVPFMCAVLTAKLVGDSMTPSIYDCHAKFNGYAPIEEQRDIRLEASVADLALPLPSHAWLDAAAPLRLEALRLLADEPGGGTQPADCRADADALLVVCRAQGLAVLPGDVVGVVERARLRRWLRRQASSSGARCSFAQGAASATDVPGGEGDSFGDVVDASGLVDTNVARLSLHAPLLTAYCVFKQKPKLRYCVCFDERHAGRLCLLSRESFDAALSETKAPLARAPYYVAGSPTRRSSVGAAAVADMLGLTSSSLFRSLGSDLGVDGGPHQSQYGAARRAPHPSLEMAPLSLSGARPEGAVFVGYGARG